MSNSAIPHVQRGVSTPGWGPGPLSRREAGVSWYAEAGDA